MTWATSVPILVFLHLSVLDLGPMYATDRRQTASLCGGIIIIIRYAMSANTVMFLFSAVVCIKFIVVHVIVCMDLSLQAGTVVAQLIGPCYQYQFINIRRH